MRRTLNPVSSAEGMADKDETVLMNLKQGSSEATVTPAGGHKQTAPYGQLVLGGIPSEAW